MKKNLTKFIFLMVLLIVLLLPVGALYYLSGLEQAEYQDVVYSEVQLKEMSYGTPVQIFRMDVAETITLSGTIISTDVIYEELEFPEPEKLRLLVEPGDLLQEGDLLGYYEGEKIYATKTGVIRSVKQESDAYIELWSFDALAFESYVTESQLKILNRSGLALTDTEGNSYQVSHIEDVSIGNAETRVLFTSETARFIYGQKVNSCKLNTGRIYKDSLVVESRCIYSYNGGQTNYVRLVTEAGEIIGESEVEVGYMTGLYTCITGVEEGGYCDPGYKSIVEE